MTPYEQLEFPDAPPDRPYTFINMVATIDGKTVIGDRDESVAGLGSKADQEAMDRIEGAADAVLLGAQTLRATSRRWNPKSPMRIAVTRSGDLPFDAMFFRAPGAKSFVALPEDKEVEIPDGIGRIGVGQGKVDVEKLVRKLRKEFGIERLHVLGGSELNAQVLRAGLVDELFLTVAPKVKLGREMPTYAGGDPLDKEHLLQFTLVSCQPVENEVFLRYRRQA